MGCNLNFQATPVNKRTNTMFKLTKISFLSSANSRVHICVTKIVIQSAVLSTRERFWLVKRVSFLVLELQRSIRKNYVFFCDTFFISIKHFEHWSMTHSAGPLSRCHSNVTIAMYPPVEVFYFLLKSNLSFTLGLKFVNVIKTK